MPTFDSGDVAARLTLDRTPFNRALDQAKADAAAFEKRGVNVRLGVDRKGFDAALKKAQADAAKFSRQRYDAKVGIDSKALQSQIDRLKAQLDALGKKKTEPPVTPKVNDRELIRLREELSRLNHSTYSVNLQANDAQARAKILAFKASLAGINQRLTSNLDVKGAAAIEAKMASVNAQLDAFGRKRVTATANVRTSGSGGIDSLVRKINGPGGLVAALIAIAPAAVPVGAAVTGVLGAIGTASVAAVAPVGVFALAVKDSFGAAQSAAVSLSKAQGKVNAAQAALNDAKGPKARTEALKKLTAAQQHLNSVEKSMDPATKSLAKNYNEVTTALTHWDQKAALPAVAKVTNTLMPAIRVGLKAMTPLVKGAGNAFAVLGTDLSKAVTGPGGTRFIKFLEVQGPKAIVGFGKAIGHIGAGFGGILEAFAPFQGKLLGGLDTLTGKFADWGRNLGSSSGFHKFIQYIKDNGPQVGKLLKTAGQAVLAIVQAAAGFGGSELRNITTVLAALVNFSKAHPTVMKFAVATLALAKAVQVLKLASIGGSIVKVIAAIAAARAGGGIAGIAGALGGKTAKAAGGATAAEGAAGGGALASLSGAIPALIAGAVLRGIDVYERGKHPTYGSVANQLDAKNPIGIGTGQNDVIAATFGKVFTSVLGLFFDKKKPAPKPVTPGGVNDATGAGANSYGQGKLPSHGIAPYVPPGINAPPNLPAGGVKIGVNSTAATIAILKVQKALGLLPKNKNISMSSPGAKTTRTEIDNVYLAQHHLPGSRKIPVTAPGANLSVLQLINVGRAAKGLKPTAKVNVSSPGAKGARQDINTLAHQAGLLPKSKNISTSVKGAKGAILDLINLDRKAHGLKPVASIRAAIPGADAAVKKLITLGQRAGVLPKVKYINVSTPGAVKAYGQLNDLLHKANVLPKGKSIPTDVPGAQKSILTYIQLYEKAHHLPVDKKIPTSAPGGDHTIAQMIDLARKIGAIPSKHSTQINTPGYDSAHFNVISMATALNKIPKTVNVAMKVIGTASDVLSKGLGFADGGALPLPRRAAGGTVDRPGYVRGPGGGRDDLVTYAPGGVPIARVSNTEYINKASVVSREGVGAFEALNRGMATIVPRFADGGTVLNVNMSGPNVASMKAGIKGFLNQSGKNISADQEKHIQKELASLGSGGGGGNWAPVIAQALAMLHQPVGLAGLFERVIAGESGGNPRAINLYDSNAKAGHPSVGLAQVIRGTFEAFAGPFRNVGPFLAGVSVNPLANIYAGLNYGIQTYGSVANIPGIASELHGGGYRPYAEGGPVGMHAGGPVEGVKKGAAGEWVKALAIQARQLRGAFHQGTFSGTVSDELNRDWPSHEPHHLPNLAKYDPKVKQLVAFLWGRHGKATTMDDALGHFNHGRSPMAFLDIMRAYDAGKGYLTEKIGKGKGRHRLIPDSTLKPFQSGLRRYESMYHHDVQALEHKIKFKPENGQWGAGLDAPVAHVIAHALGKPHSQFLPRPWAPLDAAEKALQAALKSNSQNAELRKDFDLFSSWKLIDLVQTLTGDDVATALPIARAAARHKAEAIKLNAAYRVADTSVFGGATAPGFAKGGLPRPGLAWVGERGPELVNFKGREQVYPASQSRRMASESGFDYKRLGQEVAAAMKASVRSAPLIGEVSVQDNAQIELAIRQAAYAAERVGL